MIVAPDDGCKKCLARYKMQKKYIDQIGELYDDFHVTKMFLEDEEVRGVEGLKEFCGKLL